jgi:hypothetical protein
MRMVGCRGTGGKGPARTQLGRGRRASGRASALAAGRGPAKTKPLQEPLTRRAHGVVEVGEVQAQLAAAHFQVHVHKLLVQPHGRGVVRLARLRGARGWVDGFWRGGGGRAGEAFAERRGARAGG